MARPDFTPEEEFLIAHYRTEPGGRLGAFEQDLMLMVPAGIIAGLGLAWDDDLTVVIGLVVYAGFRLRSCMHQRRYGTLLKSAIEKYEKAVGRVVSTES